MERLSKFLSMYLSYWRVFCTKYYWLFDHNNSLIIKEFHYMVCILTNK